MENLASPLQDKREILFFSNLIRLHLNVEVKYRTKQNIYRTIRPQTMKSSNKTVLLWFSFQLGG